MYRISRGSFLPFQRIRADFALPNFGFKRGKVTSGVVEGRGEVILVGDEAVVLLAVLVVRELDGCSRRLGLYGFDALLDVVKGHLEHLPFSDGGDGVPERGERTHVRRWGGKREVTGELGHWLRERSSPG